MTSRRTPRNVLDKFFAAACRDPISSLSLAEMLFDDLGIDAGLLSAAEIKRALNGGKVENWSDMAFAMNEALTSYTFEKLSNADQAKAISASMIYLTAVDNDFGDIEFCFWKIVSILHHNRDDIDVEFGVLLVEQLMLRH